MDRRKVVVKHNYEPVEVDELKLNAGEIIEVMAEVEEGWWRGKKADRTVGLFPSNYVQPVEPQIHTFNGEFVPGSPINFTPVGMNQTVPAAISDSSFEEESVKVMVEEAAPSRSSTISFGSDIQANSPSDGYFALAMVTSVTKTDATAITASRRQFPLLATQFQPGQTLKCRGEDLRVYLRSNDSLKLWLERENLVAAVVNTDGYGREDGLSQGVVDSITPPVGNIWSSTVGNIQFRIDKSSLLKVGDRVKFNRLKSSGGNGELFAHIVDLVEEDSDELVSEAPFSRHSAATSAVAYESNGLRMLETRAKGENLRPKDSSPPFSGFYDVAKVPTPTLSVVQPVSTGSSARETRTEVSTSTAARATVTLAGSTQLLSQSQAVVLPQRKKSPQDFIDLLLTASRQSDSAVTRHSGIGFITTAYQRVARLYCQTGELVPINSEDFICDPNVPLYDLFKPLMVAKYVVERSYNKEIQQWQEQLLFLQLTNDPYPYWDQLDVCVAEVTGHLDSRDYFSGVFLKTEKLSKLMMPRYAYFQFVVDLTAKMPIGQKMAVVTAPNCWATDMPEHSSHQVIMCAPSGVSSRIDLISRAADVQLSTERHGGFSDPTPLVDLREEILQRPIRYSPAVFNSVNVAPPQNPIFWPSDAKVRVERGVGLITTIYKKYGQMWIPTHGSEMFHVDGLRNVRCKYVGQLVKPLQLARFTMEVSDRKNAKGILSCIIELEPIQGDVDQFSWDQLQVCHCRVIKPLPNKKPTANKPGFSAVLLKSSKFYGKLIFMPNYAYPHYTTDLPIILPVDSHLNVVVFRQELKRGKEVIPLAAVACVPSHVLTIADLKRYVAACPP